jgi:hypothetical protein
MVGFLAQFGLLGIPVYKAFRATWRAESGRDRVMMAGFTLIVGLSRLEQIPNASVSSWTWFLSGALLGRSQRLHAMRRKTSSYRGRRIAQPTSSGAEVTGDHVTSTGSKIA